MFPKKVFQQRRDVFLSLAQGRQSQSHPVDSEKQFPAKTPSLDFLFQAARGRRNQSRNRLLGTAFWFPVRQKGK
jgi:hypothetical protein